MRIESELPRKVKDGARVGLAAATIFGFGFLAGCGGDNADNPTENTQSSASITLKEPRIIHVTTSDGTKGVIQELSPTLLGVASDSKWFYANDAEEIVGLIDRECNVTQLFPTSTGGGVGFSESAAFIRVDSADECMNSLE